MKRLLPLATIPALGAVATVALYWNGLAWPVLTTAYGLFGKRPALPETEDDYLA